MYDSTVSGSGPGAGAPSRSPAYASPGDVVFVDRTECPAMTAHDGGVAMGRVECSEMEVLGCSVERELTLAEYRRLRPGVVTGASFADGALDAADASGVVPVRNGGTGVDATDPAMEGGLLVGGLEAVEPSPGLRWDGVSLSAPALGLGGFTVSAAGPSNLMVTGPRSSLLGGSLGARPSVTLARGGAGEVVYSASSLDGSAVASVVIAAYDAGGWRPRLPDEVYTGSGAAETVRVPFPAGSGSVTFAADPSSHVFAAVAEDARGNISRAVSSPP